MLCGTDDRFAQRMLRAGLDRCSNTEQLGFLVCPKRQDIGHGRFAARNRARLVKDNGGQFLSAFEHFAAADQDAGVRAFSHADHQGGRRRYTQSARAGDDKHGNKGEQPLREMPRERPSDDSQQCNAHDRRHKIAGHLVGQPLNLCRACLRVFYHLDDLRQRRIRTDAGRLERKGA